jgi:glycosyltransferase involved in cell wall biosynthesis
MIRTIAAVIRGEGAASAARRTGERIGEAAQHAAFRMRGLFAAAGQTPIVNVALGGVAPRTGGVAIQLMARLRAERTLRSVALLHPGTLFLSTPFAHERRIAASDFTTSVRDALSITGARAVHVEGTYGLPLADTLRLIDAGIAVVISVHDFSLAGDLARQLLGAATGVIFPSQFLLDRHRELFAASGEVVEPAIPAAERIVQIDPARKGIAYAGSVKRHKGGHLLPEIARGLDDLHVFGGGDEELLRPLRRMPNVSVHGYYRSGTLPSLLARHGIGLVLIPSIVPEAYCMTMSEAWMAGASVGAFDLGAPAERIRRDGGGWLAPIESGAEGLVEIVERWRSEGGPPVPRVTALPIDAARAHVELYRRWGCV